MIGIGSDLVEFVTIFLIGYVHFVHYAQKKSDVEKALNAFETNRRDVAEAVVKISQKGLFLGQYNVDPLAIRYQNEIEPLTTFSNES